MSLSRFHFVAVSGWVVAVVLAVSVRAALGLPPWVWEVWRRWFALAPALMVMTVFRGAPPQTVAEVLYDAERTRNLARDRLSRVQGQVVGGNRHLLQRRSRTLWYTARGEQCVRICRPCVPARGATHARVHARVDGHGKAVTIAQREVAAGKVSRLDVLPRVP